MAVKIDVHVLRPEAGSAGSVSVTAHIDDVSADRWKHELAQVMFEIRSITGGYPPVVKGEAG